MGLPIRIEIGMAGGGAVLDAVVAGVFVAVSRCSPRKDLPIFLVGIIL